MEIVRFGKEIPMTSNGCWIRGCSMIPCIQPGFQKDSVQVSPAVWDSFTGGWSQSTLREQGCLRNP